MNHLIKVVETSKDGQTTDNEKNKQQFYGTCNTCLIHPQCQNKIIACLELPLASLKYPPPPTLGVNKFYYFFCFVFFYIRRLFFQI